MTVMGLAGLKSSVGDAVKTRPSFLGAPGGRLKGLPKGNGGSSAAPENSSLDSLGSDPGDGGGNGGSKGDDGGLGGSMLGGPGGVMSAACCRCFPLACNASCSECRYRITDMMPSPTQARFVHE